MGIILQIDSGEPDLEAAYEAAKEGVLKNLKSPASAQFPEYSESSIRDEQGGSFRVTSYVDSQNSFGAMIRSDFTCDVTLREDGSYFINPFTLSIE